MTAYIEQRYGSWYVRGGLRTIADALLARCRDLGVEVHLNSEVTGVRVTGGRATGVRLAGGAESPADVVVCNADATVLYERPLAAPGCAQRYADHVLATLAARGTDVRDHIRWRDVRTPADLERDTGAPGGAIYGTASHGARAALLRPSNRSPVPGLYLVGGSAHPGAGGTPHRAAPLTRSGRGPHPSTASVARPRSNATRRSAARSSSRPPNRPPAPSAVATVRAVTPAGVVAGVATSTRAGGLARRWRRWPGEEIGRLAFGHAEIVLDDDTGAGTADMRPRVRR